MIRSLCVWLRKGQSSSKAAKHARRMVKIHMIVGRITYKQGWTIGVFEKDYRPYIQLTVLGRDAVTGRRCRWTSAKSWVSDFACDQEIVGAVFKLIKDAEVHELHEWFRYRGAAIYNPHLNPDALVAVAKDKSNFIARADSMTNA